MPVNYTILIIIILNVLYFPSKGQFFVQGYIVGEDKKPLSDCVVFSSLNEVNVSNSKGYFSVRVKGVGDTLKFNLLGFEPTRVIINKELSEPIFVELLRLDKQLDEIVISTGYYTLPKERVTGSFELIDKKLILRNTSINFLDRLEGVSSILFDRRNGVNGLTIRGRSTIFANSEPLIVVDGFVYDGDLKSLNPNDIDRITLLKDAAASSIWGARAANGVLVVETISGRFKQKPQLQFNANLTYGSNPDLYYQPTMSSSDFIELERELFGKGYYNSTLTNNRYPVVSPVVELLDKHRKGHITNDELESKLNLLKKQDVREDLAKYFYRNSFNQQYYIGFKGGLENYNYSISAGWDRNLSEVVRNSQDRLTLSSSGNYKPIGSLLLETKVGFTFGQNFKNGNVNSISPTSKSIYPYAKLVDEYGNPLILEKDHRIAFLDTAGGGRLLDWMFRPLEELYLSDNRINSKNIRSSIGLKFKVFDQLKIEAGYQYEMQMSDSRIYYSEDSYTARNLINRYSHIQNNVLINRIPKGGILDKSSDELIFQCGRLQVHYDKDWFLKHKFTVLGGAEIRQSLLKSDKNRTYGFNSNTLVFQNVNFADLFPTYANLSGNQRIINPSSFDEINSRYVSFYANSAYSFYDRYAVTLSMRKDASNLFGVEHNQKGVPLWSSGLSWDISKESFFHLPQIEYLKTRISYGVAGNVDNTLSALTTVAFYMGNPLTGLDYAMMRSPGNQNLRWEKQYQFNAGIDFSLSKNTLLGSIDFFVKKGVDLIGDSPIDPTTGITDSRGLFQFRGNVANTSGYGVDAVLNYSEMFDKLRISSCLIFGHVINKVTKYLTSSNQASTYTSFGNIVSPMEGKPIYAIYSYKWEGLDYKTGDPVGLLEGVPSKNYQAIISSPATSLVYHGSATPIFLGSIRNTIEFKNWSISAILGYKLGYYFRRSSINYNSLFSNWVNHSDYSLRWQKPGDEEWTQVPSLVYPAVSARDAFYAGSEILVERGDHLRLQDLNFGYQSVNSKLFKNYHINLNIRNLGIVWKANKVGLDPDLYNGGIPPVLTVSIGFQTNI